MKLLRRGTSNLYELFSQNSNYAISFAIYWSNADNSAELSFDNSFIKNIEHKWLGIFYADDQNLDLLNSASALSILNSIGANNAALLWVEDVQSNVAFFDNSRRLILKGNQIKKEELAFQQDNSNKFRFYFRNISGSSLSLVNDTNLFIKAGRRDLQIRINGASAILENASIGIVNQSGSIQYKAINTTNKAIPIVVPYISKKKYKTFNSGTQRPEPVTLYKFVDEKGAIGQQLNAEYYPFRNTNHSKFKFSPSTAYVTTQIPNLKGQKLTTNDIHQLTFQLNQLKISEKDDIFNRYLLIPTEGEINLSSAEMLVGNSGTESLKLNKTDNQSIRLRFDKGTQLLADDEDFDLSNLLSELNEASFTSKISIQQETSYHLDAERSPSFINSKSSTYEPVGNSLLPADNSFPFIPTLAFRDDDDDLLDLEKVFSKLRIQQAQKHRDKVARNKFKSSNRITPQGFTKTGTSYDFIKKPSLQKRDEGSTTEFQFSLDGYGEDFNLSIRKNQVFFVMTPGLFEQYKSQFADIKMKAKFAINNSANADLRFVLDMVETYEKAKTDLHSESILIFKFHNRSLERLLEDTNEWSNEGEILRNDLRPIKKEIEKLITTHRTQNKDNTKENYLEHVLTNKNWNGILMLNIPLGSADNLPKIFRGLSASQRTNLKEPDTTKKVKLKTELKFQYAAFPVNKTKASGNSVVIESTAFFGLIDYDPFRNETDYKKISKHFQDGTIAKTDPCHYVLSKLFVTFENSEIREFESYAFLQIPSLFEDTISFEELELTHPNSNYEHPIDKKRNLVLLEGSYQKTFAKEEFLFRANMNGLVEFSDDNLLKNIKVSRIGFSYDQENFRFDLNASAELNSWSKMDLVSIEQLDFENIGLKIKIAKLEIPNISFDLSKLSIFPKIQFDGNGFLSSFPLKFSHFQIFKVKSNKEVKNDYFLLPGFENLLPDVNLFSLVFDFDLGTLGDLEALKALKGKLYFGWTASKGFAMGFKFAESGSKGLHLDLFGAIKIDIETIDYGKFKPKDAEECSGFYLRLNDARLKIFNVDLPPEATKFNGIIMSDFSSNGSKKIAWLINLENIKSEKLLLGVGQRMGPPLDANIRTTTEAIKRSQDTFAVELSNIDTCSYSFYDKINFRPNRNWLIASESVFGLLGSDWEKLIDLKFIFNDPVLYGIHLGLAGDSGSSWGGLSIDILYKRMSDNLGAWSAELVLPDYLRYQEFGAASVTFPNFGIDVFTNGDWKLDIGYPISTADWSRSCQIQIFPLVGWAGFYLTKVKSVELSIFGPYKDSLTDVDIVQAGMAFRLGIGKYIHKGPFHAGASISVYAVMEGAFAFDNKDQGISEFFPDHFAMRGRVGAIAEIVGYVDFRIVKASVHIFLRVEVGMLLAVIDGDLQPVPLYIEGRVGVKIRVTIKCFKIFRKKICIRVTFRYSTHMRFQYTLGGGNKKLAKISKKLQLLDTPIRIPIGEIPVLYIPSVTKSIKNGKEETVLIHGFAINFFGYDFDNEDLLFGKQNILTTDIIIPIFKTLIEDYGLTSYEQLRSVLIEDPDSKNVDLEFPDFRPTLHHGYSLENDQDYITSVYRLNENKSQEFTKFKNLVDTNSCVNDPNRCPFRPIPLPISNHINLRGKNGQDHKWEDGFQITIDELFTDVESKTNSVTQKFGPLLYNEIQIDKIEKFFDHYKTQYLDRKTAKRDLLEVAIDLRTKLIIPEYFKLIVLLTLEACYGKFINADGNKKKTTAINPSIRLISDLTDPNYGSIEWEHIDQAPFNVGINTVLEDVIGQLNYFYNSGLRLHDPNNKKSITSPYSEMLGMTNTVQFNNGYIPKDVAINFQNKDGDETVNITKDLFENVTGVKEYANETKAFLRAVKLDQLHLDFKGNDNPFKSPYQLTDLVLSIHSSRIGLVKGGNTTHKFYELPKQLLSLGHEKVNDKRLSYQLSIKEDVKEGQNTAISEFVPCANINIEVATVASEANDRKVLEISNVFLEDLQVANHLKSLGSSVIRAVKIYEKPKTKDNEPIKLKDLKNLDIIKTNLSKRTTPPIIIPSLAKVKKASTKNLFMANSKNEKAKFIQLVWEGLTTNNGGYYFVLPKDMSFDVGSKLMVSVEFDQQKSPHFCNFVKLKTSVSKALNSDDTLLVIDHIKQANNAVKEYHTTIPVHCVGLSIDRNIRKEAHNQFLPLEYEIIEGGKVSLSKDHILPIAPKNLEAKDANGKLNLMEDSLIYEHVTPLTAYKSSEHRYSNIGKQFNFKFGLRDMYGHRVTDNLLPNIEQYTHRYYDKLVPVSAWPLVKTKTEFINYSKSVTRWRVVIDIDKNGYNKYLQSTDQAKSTIKSQLSTIIEQLLDVHCQVKVEMNNGQNVSINTKTFVKLLKSLKDESYQTTSKPITKNYDCKIIGLKTLIEAKVVVERIANTDLFHFPTKEKTLILENEAIKKVVTPLMTEPDLSKDTKNHLELLQEQLDSVNSNLLIGVGSSGKSGKSMYFIDTLLLDKAFPIIDPNNNTISSDNFLGVMPYSTNLWSGTYNHSNGFESFTGIDLDSGLRVILEKIDDLLSAKNVVELYSKNKKELQTLLAAKRKLIDDSGKGLGSKTAYLNKVESKTIQIFKELVYNRLANFYNYDGIVYLPLKDEDSLKGHRFSLSFNDQHNNYNIRSAKISYLSGDPHFTVLFDNAKNNQSHQGTGSHDFTVRPKITHLEYDVQSHSDSEIMSSKWIQLVRPYAKIAANTTGYKIQFPSIIREFPPKPRIIIHKAEHEIKSSVWSKKIGAWNYLLGVEDKGQSGTQENDKYFDGDRITIKLKYKSLENNNRFAKENLERSFEGFIAFWSSKIIANEFEASHTKNFINELDSIFSQNRKMKLLKKKDVESAIFKLEKGSGTWKNITEKPSPILKLKANSDLVLEKLIFTGPNIFINNKDIVSIIPTVFVTRNEKDIINSNFHYKTQSVEPNSWVTPLISFANPLSIKNNQTFKEALFEIIPTSLPYKVTAKYLLNISSKSSFEVLPTIPIKQIEIAAGEDIPTDTDELFKGYTNGYESFALTIYNQDESASNLPVFVAETIYKKE